MRSLIFNVIWNGMLAILPVVFACLIASVAHSKSGKWPKLAAAAVLGLLWFGFLPNTCYLLTEWRHFLEMLDSHNLFLRARSDNILFAEMSAWSLFYAAYSGFGMLTFALAIRPIDRLLHEYGAPIWMWALPFFVAQAVGVYLGLILRYNTWDLLTQPSAVWNTVLETALRPKLAAFIVAFGVVLWGAYAMVDIWIDGMRVRLSRRSAPAVPEP